MDMTLPQVIDQLEGHLGGNYNSAHWKPVLDIVLNAEGNSDDAMTALAKFKADINTTEYVKSIINPGKTLLTMSCH